MSEKYKNLPDWSDKFFDVLARYGVQEVARRAVKLKSAGAITAWKKNNTEFMRRFDAAKIAHQEVLEGEMVRRAVHGREETVIYRGQPQYQRNPATGVLLKDDGDEYIPVTVTRYSDQLLLAKLKAEMPDKYGGSDTLALTAIRNAKENEDHVAPSKAELVDRLKRMREGKKAELALVKNTG